MLTISCITEDAGRMMFLDLCLSCFDLVLRATIIEYGAKVVFNHMALVSVRQSHKRSITIKAWPTYNYPRNAVALKINLAT